MSEDVTDLLLAWNEGDRNALDRLLPLILDEMRKLASIYLHGEREGHTLEPTALVNEVYLRLVDRKRVDWQDRAHFFAFAATTMRRVLVDHARSHRAEKRGGDRERVTLADDVALTDQRRIDVIDLDAALVDLERLDPRLARVVELRFFAGLSVEETAEVVGQSRATVNRDWRAAKSFLLHRLGGAESQTA